VATNAGQFSEWFSEFLGVPCWLARHSGTAYTLPLGLPRESVSVSLRSPHVSFANEQPLLLISEHAVDSINYVLSSQGERLVSTMHFRPNMVVRLVGRAADAYSHTEDGWKQIELIGKDTQLEVAGPCARCSMVDVDPSSGMKGKTLRALADYRRRNNGQITFGIFLRGVGDEKSGQPGVWLEEGDTMFCK
jgi:molybdenum cofactor sulfurtransferase